MAERLKSNTVLIIQFQMLRKESLNQSEWERSQSLSGKLDSLTGPLNAKG